MTKSPYWHALYLDPGHADNRRVPDAPNRFRMAQATIANLEPNVTEIERVIYLALLRLADAHLAAADGKTGADREPHLREATYALQDAMRYTFDQPDAWTLLALIHGEDPMESSRAVNELYIAVKDHPDYWPAWIGLGRAYEKRARLNLERGRSIESDLRAAWDAYWHAAEMDGWIDWRTRASVHLWRLAEEFPAFFMAGWQEFKQHNSAASLARQQAQAGGDV